MATVPNSAATLYKSKALLHWSGVQLNGGAIAASGDDAVQVVAYFGDANGDGTLSGGDAADISAVNLSTNAATGTLGGFSAYPLADPVIIGDLNNNGNADSADVTLLNSFLAGIPRTQIPTVPTGLTIVPTGPDPSLSVPTMPQLLPGGTVVVPVNIDTAHPLGSTGATEAILALRYNPQLFNVSAADVQLGSLTAGWQLTTVVNAQTGEIGIDLLRSYPIQTAAGGRLVTITFEKVGSDAELAVAPRVLSLVNQVDPTGQRLFRTTVSDDQGAFVLHFENAQSPAGMEQKAASSMSLAVDNGASSVQSAAHSPLPAAHNPPLFAHYFELQAALLRQPPVLDADEVDVAAANSDGLHVPRCNPMASSRQTGSAMITWPTYCNRSSKRPLRPASVGRTTLSCCDGIHAFAGTTNPSCSNSSLLRASDLPKTLEFALDFPAWQ